MRYQKVAPLVVPMAAACLLAVSLGAQAENEAYKAWDKVEDAAEGVGSVVEENWEKLEDAVIPETEEERREEAQERAEDAAEEAEEERIKRGG
ncbi:MAG: hypothetical protein ACPHER_07010 [Nevskiales bacterium]